MKSPVIVKNVPVKHHSFSMMSLMAIGFVTYIVTYHLGEKVIARRYPVSAWKQFEFIEVDTH